MPGVFALIGVILLFLAGLSIGGQRIAPAWLGLAFLALAAFWVPITGIGG